MQLRAALFCFTITVLLLSGCHPGPPAANPEQVARWYEEDAIERIIIADAEKIAEIHLRSAPETKPRKNRTYSLAYNDFGQFLNDYLTELNEKFPGRNLIITIR